MYKYLWLLLAALCSLAFTADDRKEYPLNYFRSPVNHPIRLSGTFGELRPNHLHAGIDIKSKDGKIGQPLFATADGYVSRIKIQSGGYGNVLYFNHPNGYTSVYAHLKEFPTAIAEYVKEYQYKRKSFELELFPEANRFFFKKGEIVGKLGLSGRSFGPHLHFEIRDTRTEKPINPLLFGIDVTDKIPPKLHKLKAYHLNDKLETIGEQSFSLIRKGRDYGIKGDTLYLAAWRTGLALKAFDHMNGASNWNGIYSLEMKVDQQTAYQFEMETFAFSETRYINAHLDYAEQVSRKSYYHRCYQLPGNRLSIYSQQKDNGVIQLSKSKAQLVEMIAEDVDGNKASLRFWVKRKEVSPPESKAFNYLLPYDEENAIQNASLDLFFPKNTFYENVYLQYHTSREKSTGVYSSVHHIHNFKTPVHRYYDIAIRPNQIPDELRDKAYIAYCRKDGKMESCGGEWKDGLLRTKVRSFGDYCIMADKIAPRIQPIQFRYNMQGSSRMSFKVTDNIPTARNVDYIRYEATVDGKWLLMDYDAKKDLLTHRFDGTIERGEHVLRLMASDSRGNQKVFERKFKR
ncbi:MAG: M23 family metallopeptidase [Bacteroidota bacterium]